MKVLNSKDFLPIAISGIVITSSGQNQTIKYNDLYQNNIQINDEYTQNHLNLAIQSSYKDLLVKMKYIEHLEKWKLKTRFLSSPNKIVEDVDFQEIIKLGIPVVNFIAQDLKEEPSYLVWALNIIYGFKISDDSNTTISDASKLWLKFLKV